MRDLRPSDQRTQEQSLSSPADLYAFHFKKPPGFQFKAGQYIDLTLFGSQPEPFRHSQSAAHRWE